MTKLGKDNTIITDSEVDQIILILEAIHSETGCIKVFNIIEILMKETVESIKSNISD